MGLRFCVRYLHLVLAIRVFHETLEIVLCCTIQTVYVSREQNVSLLKQHNVANLATPLFVSNGLRGPLGTSTCCGGAFECYRNIRLKVLKKNTKKLQIADVFAVF